MDIRSRCFMSQINYTLCVHRIINNSIRETKISTRGKCDKNFGGRKQFSLFSFSCSTTLFPLLHPLENLGMAF